MSVICLQVHNINDSSLFNLSVYIFFVWLYLGLKLLFSIPFHSLSILWSQLLNFDELSLSLFLDCWKICLKLCLYFFFGLYLLFLVGLNNLISEVLAVLYNFLPSQKIFRRLAMLLFSFVNFSSILFLNLLNLLLDLLYNVSFSDVELPNRCDFGFVDWVSVFLCNLGNFFWDLLFPDVIFGNVEHGIPSILVDEKIKIVLRMTGSRTTTVAHVKNCFAR